jgi:hypothetical protein
MAGKEVWIRGSYPHFNRFSESPKNAFIDILFN